MVKDHRRLTRENGELKKLLAEAMPDNKALQSGADGLDAGRRRPGGQPPSAPGGYTSSRDCSRQLKALSAVDEYTRQCVCLKVDMRISGSKAVAMLYRAAVAYGCYPEIRVVRQGFPAVGAGLGGEDAVHRAGQAEPERLLREFQWQV